MKVKELMGILEGYDPDATVLLGIQPNYPFECSIRKVVSREDFADEDDNKTGKEPNDVLILEGRQLRYGSKNAW